MKKILIYSNRKDFIHNFQEILFASNFSTTITNDIDEGIKFSTSIQPDLIVCDSYTLGLQSLRFLNLLSESKETKDIPCLYITTNYNQQEHRTVMNSGATDYLVEPLSEIDFIQSMTTQMYMRNKSTSTFNIIESNKQNELVIYDIQNLFIDKNSKSYKRNSRVYQENDYANFLYIVRKGKIKSIQTDYYGKEFVSELYNENDIFGYIPLLEGKRNYHETTVAMEDSEIAVIPKEDFIDLLDKNQEICIAFMKLLSRNIREKEKRLLRLAYSPVRERVAEALLHLTHDSMIETKPTSSIIIARDDLACIVGTAKESLIRMLSELKHEGLIDTNGQRIDILDKSRLIKTAKGC